MPVEGFTVPNRLRMLTFGPFKIAIWHFFTMMIIFILSITMSPVMLHHFILKATLKFLLKALLLPLVHAHKVAG